jgi:probable phosphoglycerate mutase
MKIFIVRHGETEWNRTKRFQGISDIPLNERGKAQAEALAHALKDDAIDVVYSSPLIRAKETARAVHHFHPSSLFFEEEGLREMNLGEFEGIKAKEWGEQYPEFSEKWRESPSSIQLPGGESLKGVQIRAVQTLDRIIKYHLPETTLLICSHNFVIHAILCHALEISLDNFREIKQETAALNLLSARDNHLKVEKINEVSHLKRLNKDWYLSHPET